MRAQTVERQELQRVIDALPEDGIVLTLDFVRNLRREIPNAETREAMTELRAGKGEKVTIEQIMVELNEGN